MRKSYYTADNNCEGKKIRIIYWDKMGRKSIYEEKKGITLHEFLNKNNIPSHALLAISEEKPLRLKDKIVSDVLCLNMYNYDFVSFLQRIKKRKTVFYGEKKDIIFIKDLLRFSKDGNVKPYSINMDARNFKKYYEGKLRRVVYDRCKLRASDKIAIGFSGGIDSSSCLLALKNSGLSNEIDITAITVTGVPDAESPRSLKNASYLTSKLRIPHVISRPEDIQDIFNLKTSFLEIVKKLIRDKKTSSKTIFLCHAVIRRILEEYAKSSGIKTIALCVEAEGMVANILSSVLSGYPILGIFKRKINDFEYIYPICTFTKSENLLYVFLNERSLLLQEPSGEVHQKAPDLRTAMFTLFSKMNEVFPGFYEYMILSLDHLLENFLDFSKIKIKKCINCGGYFLNYENKNNKDSEDLNLCPVCKLLSPYIEIR